jgi:hypothetical protein
MKIERGPLNSDQCILRKKEPLGRKANTRYVDRRITAKCALMGCEDADSVDLIQL